MEEKTVNINDDMNAVDKWLEGADGEEMSPRENALPLVAQAAVDQSGKTTHVELHIHGCSIKDFDAADDKHRDAAKKNVGTYGGDVWKTFTLAEGTCVEGVVGSVQITYFLDRDAK